MEKSEERLFNSVMRYLERKERNDPNWTLYLGDEEFTALQLRDRLRKDKKLWKMVRAWADDLAVDLFDEGEKEN